tara:strand:- start:426 stop:1016 length:591 start_codon:yes stop_codon:yes gene_type:complete
MELKKEQYNFIIFRKNLNTLMMKKIILTLSAMIFIFAALAADIVTLNNKMVFSGEVTKIKNCQVFFKSEGNKYIIPASEIFSIQFEDIKNKVYTSYMNLPDGENKCLNGQMDAENFHGKKGGHFALGFLFGPFAMIGTLLASPTPDKGKRTYMMSKNKEQFTDYEYISCYEKKAKGELIGMEAAGWGSWLLLVLLL